MLCAIWLLPGIAVTNGSKDVSRINCGVHFRHITPIQPVNNIWRHSYAFEIPRKFHDGKHHPLLVGLENEEGTTRREPWIRNCITWYDELIHFQLNTSTATAPTDQRSLCVKYQGVIKKMIRNIKIDQDELNEAEAKYLGTSPRNPECTAHC